ncbi:endonuclease domain-containing protein [Rufibacter roseus]|uniref:Endonuclease domain-containing protein n=1 Tax=Rufibacter roseus TaxID=1567108 RepID=A0ABW2DQ79_9BACT|nr:DUF559 domain-containing protein [Rufibacter roseus]
MPNKIIPYRPDLKERAKELRNNSTLGEILLWNELKGKSLGVEFHRQVPLFDYIVDFFCHELLLAVEVDGDSHDHKITYDENRQRALQAYGVKFLRFTDKEVKQEMPYVVETLWHWVQENRQM